MIPTFEVSQMIRKADRKIGSKTAHQMATWAHYRFRQQLTFKCRQYGCKVAIVNEAYTSKTCSCCGHVKHNFGAKTYKCTSCGAVMNRYVNGAKNIFLRNYEALGISVSGIGAYPLQSGDRLLHGKSTAARWWDFLPGFEVLENFEVWSRRILYIAYVNLPVITILLYLLSSSLLRFRQLISSVSESSALRLVWLSPHVCIHYWSTQKLQIYPPAPEVQIYLLSSNVHQHSQNFSTLVVMKPGEENSVPLLGRVRNIPETKAGRDVTVYTLSPLLDWLVLRFFHTA